jgi:hypothetical protein
LKLFFVFWYFDIVSDFDIRVSDFLVLYLISN